MTPRLLRPTRNAAVEMSTDEDPACYCGSSSMVTRRQFGDTQNHVAPAAGAPGTRALADNPTPAAAGITRSSGTLFDRPRHSYHQKRRRPSTSLMFLALAVVALMTVVGVDHADAAYFGRLDTSNFFFDDTEVDGGDSEYGSPGSGSGQVGPHGRVTNSPSRHHGLVNDVVAPGAAYHDDEDGGSGLSPLSHPFWDNHGNTFGLPVDNSHHSKGDDSDPDAAAVARKKSGQLPLVDVDAEDGDNEEGSGVSDLFPTERIKPQRKNDRHLILEEHPISDLIPSVVDIDSSFHRDADHFDITNVLQKLDSAGMLGESEQEANSTDDKIAETLAAAGGNVPSTPDDEQSTATTVPITPAQIEDDHTDPTKPFLDVPKGDEHSTGTPEETTTTSTSSKASKAAATEQPTITTESKNHHEESATILSIDDEDETAISTITTTKKSEDSTSNVTTKNVDEITTKTSAESRGEETTITATVTEVAGKNAAVEEDSKTTHGEGSAGDMKEDTTPVHDVTTSTTQKITGHTITTTLQTTTGNEEEIVPVGRSNFNSLDFDEEEKEKLKEILSETTTDDPTTSTSKSSAKPEVRIDKQKTTTDKGDFGGEATSTAVITTTTSANISKLGTDGGPQGDIMYCSDIPGDYHFAFTQSPSAIVEAPSQDEVRIMLKFIAGCEPTHEEVGSDGQKRPWSIEQFSASWIFTDQDGKSCLAVDSDQIGPRDDTLVEEMPIRIAGDIESDALVIRRCKFNGTKFDIETSYNDSACGIESNLDVTDSGGRLGGHFKIRLTYHCKRTDDSATPEEDGIVLLSALDSPASIAVRVYEKPNYAVQIAVMSAILLPLVAFVTWITFKRIRDSSRRKGMLPVSTTGDGPAAGDAMRKASNNNGSLEMVEQTNHAKTRSVENGNKSNASTVIIENGDAEGEETKFPLMKDREVAACFSTPAADNGAAGGVSSGEGWQYADDDDGEDEKAAPLIAEAQPGNNKSLNRDIEKGCY